MELQILRPKVYLVYEGRLGAGRASSTYVIENAEVFNHMCEVEIIVSKRPGWSIPDDLRSRFKIIELGLTFDPKTVIRNIVGHVAFSLAIRRYLISQAGTGVVIFHGWWPLQLVRFSRRLAREKLIVLEVHDQINFNYIFRKSFFNQIGLFVATNKFKFEELLRYYNLKTILERNAVRSDRYQKIARNVSSKSFTIGYTGTLGPEKNPKFFLTAVRRLPEISFKLAGPLDGELRDNLLRERNVELAGFLKIEEIPTFQMSCDALLVTLDPQNETSNLYTSTMKLFEYIAAQCPILAPNLPSILDILDESEFYPYEANSIESLIAALRKLREDISFDQVKLPSQKRIAEYSWEGRNSRILRKCEEIFESRF